MTETEIAWLAGLFDGEGCIHSTRSGHYYGVTIKISMGHEETVRRVHELAGFVGVVTEWTPKRYNGKGAANPAWSWWATTRACEPILRAMRPYLVTKAAEADLALEFLDLPTFGGPRAVPEWLTTERDRLYQALRDIKPTARFRAAAGA